MENLNLMPLFTASQLRRIAATRRYRDEISTGRYRFSWKGENFVMKMGVKSRTVHAVFAA